ncbi:MAG: tetratricopeptide repeat protein [Spirochaetes bacterium]|nr:tetratricopeptide repeat protein [Spirochaetota bacterium]
MKHIIPFLIFILFLCSACSKKDEAAIVAREANLASKTSINKQIEQLKEKLLKAPNDYEKAVASTQIAQLLALKGNIALMLDYSQNAVKYQPNLYTSRYLLGKSYNEVGRYQDAQKELEEAIKLKSDFAPAHFELGNSLYKQYKYPQAIEEYLTAIKYDQKMFTAMNNLALLYAQTQKYSQAEEYLKKCITTKPDFAPAYKNLGILYETRLKNSKAAIEWYKKYLTVRPNAPDRKAVESWIRMLGGAL